MSTFHSAIYLRLFADEAPVMVTEDRVTHRGLQLWAFTKHNNQNSSEYKSWLSNLISKLIPLHDPLRQMHNMILWVLSLQIFQMLYHCWWYRNIFNHQCLLIHRFCFELWLYTYKTCHLLLWAWVHLRWTEAQWENKNSMIEQNAHF